ncbi:hypothetical protein K3152_09870 [Qipengyuania sp. 1NDH17]|uniref:Uncharacterized protein n=2 Tax=Qipengyuania polymorpha TaxID=2867234 RepID=A0ABS7IYC1_9SPHN|nr:hypothetical protein [Qipengyuania polymorpha]
MTRGEAELQEMLEGRIAGEPERCIRTTRSRSLTKIDDTALVYRSGDTIWVNRTRNPNAIDDNDYLVIRKFSGNSLCRSDQITTYSRAGNFYSGFIVLDDFVPYRMGDADAS